MPMTVVVWASIWMREPIIGIPPTRSLQKSWLKTATAPALPFRQSWLSMARPSGILPAVDAKKSGDTYAASIRSPSWAVLQRGPPKSCPRSQAR
jgi:hypothetical protein